MTYHRFSFINRGPTDKNTGAKPAIATSEVLETEQMNQHIIDEFEAQRDAEDIRKTHFFAGRYENIYIGPDMVPSIRPVLECALAYARQITGEPSLRAGFWFNAMPPGSDTTLHRHDDDDELLSGVYYICTPPGSGNLIITEGGERHVIEPRAGDFVFFGPAVPHEVSRNNSDSERLSIGINFGPAGQAHETDTTS